MTGVSIGTKTKNAIFNLNSKTYGGSFFKADDDASVACTTTGRTYRGCPSILSSHMYNLQLLAA